MTSLPDLPSLFRPVVQALPGDRVPYVITLLERRSAVRYREWADQVGDADRAAGLRACADREERIADLVEGLMPDGAPRDTAGIEPAVKELERIAQEAMAGRPLSEQMAIQSAAERGGGSLWRDFAALEPDPERRAVIEECARLEDASAAYLEELSARAE